MNNNIEKIVAEPDKQKNIIINKIYNKNRIHLKTVNKINIKNHIHKEKIKTLDYHKISKLKDTDQKLKDKNNKIKLSATKTINKQKDIVSSKEKTKHTHMNKKMSAKKRAKTISDLVKLLTK